MALMNTVINLRVPRNVGKFLRGWATVGFMVLVSYLSETAQAHSRIARRLEASQFVSFVNCSPHSSLARCCLAFGMFEYCKRMFCCPMRDFSSRHLEASQITGL
jgi:hypothetical protein